MIVFSRIIIIVVVVVVVPGPTNKNNNKKKKKDTFKNHIIRIQPPRSLAVRHPVDSPGGVCM